MKKICVIGSGVMGAGIAAQIANSKHNVLLLDIVNNNLSNRNELAICAKQGLTARKSAPISHPNKLDYIEVGNLEDDLYKVAECDWIIEVIVEKLNIKTDLYNKLLPFLQKDTIISSNTSTIPLSELKKELPRDIQSRFFITHFFNPPRYMRLLELITDSSNKEESIEKVTKFITKHLGKTVISCNDTPGFIANRIGCFLLELALRRTREFNIDIETIDHIFHKYLHLPRTGIFGLMDLIGLDLMPLITKSMLDLLPKEDGLHKIYYDIPELSKLIKQGYTGKKGKGGFFKEKTVLDLNNFEYREIKRISSLPYENIEEIMSENSNLGKCITNILSEFMLYVSSLVPSVSSNIYDIDRTMQLGYNWKYGPFELFTRFLPNKGFEYVSKNTNTLPEYIQSKRYSSIDLNKFSSAINSLKDHSEFEMIDSNKSVRLLHLGDLLCFEITTKMGVLDHDVFDLMLSSISKAEKLNLPIIIYNDQTHFSAGANLKLFAEFIRDKKFDKIEEFLKLGQSAMMAIKYAKIPVISSVKGAALGGGCELMLHSMGVVAHIDSSCGLVELSAGLVPGWGGLKEMIIRGCNFDDLILSKKTPSADYLYSDYKIRNLKINMNPELLLKQSIKFASVLMKDSPLEKDNFKEYTIPAASFDKYANIELSDHIRKIIELLKSKLILPMTEDELLETEREIFLELARDPNTLKLIETRI